MSFDGRLGTSQLGNLELGSPGGPGLPSATDVLTSPTDVATKGSQVNIRSASDSLTAPTDTATRAASSRSRTATDSLAAPSDSASAGSTHHRTATDSLAAPSDSATRAASTRTRTASDILAAESDVATLHPVLVGRPGVVYIDGFNTYTDVTQRYYQSANASIVANQGRVATQSALRLQPGTGGCYVRRQLFDTPMQSLVMGIAFRMSTIQNICPLYTLEYPSTLHIGVEIDGSGHLLVRRGGSTTLATGSTVLTTGVYYWIELKATIGASGSFELWLNGALELSGSGVNTQNGGTGYVNAVQIGNTTSPGSTHFEFCDFYVSGDAIVRGDSKVIRLLPASDASLKEWQPVGPGGTNGTNLVRTPTSGSPSYSGTGSPSLAADGLVTTGPGWTAPGNFWQVDFSSPQTISRILVKSKSGGSLGRVTLTTSSGVNLTSPSIGILATFEWDFYPFAVNWIRVTALDTPISTGDLAEVEAYLASGTHYTNVNEVPPDDDTTYNEARQAGLRDTFLLETLQFAVGISAVQMDIRAMRREAGTHHVAALNTFRNLEPALGSYESLLAISDTAPSTGQAWTQGEINGAEFGYELVD